MDANRLNGWLALAGNLAVLVGLILLVVEIRQNSDLTRAQISMDRSTVSRQIAIDVANGGEFLPIDVKLRTQVDGFPKATGWSDILTPEEQRRYQFWTIARGDELQNDWYLCSIGLVPAEICQREVRFRMRRNLHRFYEMNINFNRADPGYLAEMQSLARDEGLPEIGDDGFWKR
jgi:hypothetical protein